LRPLSVSNTVRLKEQIDGVASCHGGKGGEMRLNGLYASSGERFKYIILQAAIKKAEFALR